MKNKISYFSRQLLEDGLAKHEEELAKIRAKQEAHKAKHGSSDMELVRLECLVENAVGHIKYDIENFCPPLHK